MTAVVGILNKQAIAIAADSAATVDGTNSRKIFNNSNKIFTLSKHHPVGVMIHNSSSFLSTPWEIIIKTYRKQLGDKCFDKLNDYKEDLIKYLHDNNFFTDSLTQKRSLYVFCKTIADHFNEKSLESHKDLISNPSAENGKKAMSLIEKYIDVTLPDIKKNVVVMPELSAYTFEKFEVFSKDVFDELIKNIYTDNSLIVEAGFRKKLVELCYNNFIGKEYWSDYTGLIFVGFGEKEIYPSLIPINVYSAIEDKLRYFVDDNNQVTISNSNPSGIVPFAQTDVMNTILTGIDPTLEKTYKTNIEQSLTKFKNQILKIVEKDAAIKAQVDGINIEKLFEEFNVQIDEARQKTYITPLFGALNTLSKEDLAEMAESLIYLTYLKRRITFAEESVGGPVDVAVISKGDGFIWIKRKLYFKPELNQYFFDNYFK